MGATAGFNPHVRFMTPYLDGYDDLSSAVFISLVGFWELEKDEVPPEYFEVLNFPTPRLLASCDMR